MRLWKELGKILVEFRVPGDDNCYRSGHGYVDIAGRQNWLEARLGAWSCYKNESGRRAVGTGRPKTGQFVSLAQELYWHEFGKPCGVCPRFEKKLIEGLL